VFTGGTLDRAPDFRTRFLGFLKFFQGKRREEVWNQRVAKINLGALLLGRPPGPEPGALARLIATRFEIIS